MIGDVGEQCRPRFIRGRDEMMRSTLLFVIAMLASMVTVPTASAVAPSDLVMTTKDGPRHALVFAAGKKAPHPTVIVLHGKNATAAEIAANTGFVAAAAAHGFTAVFPDGLDEAWHDGRLPDGDKPDDIGFLTALVVRLVADGVSSPGHIYLAGISNGGLMALTMACRAEKLFAGFATIIASMPAPLAACPIGPAPLVMINGTADPVIPFAGGAIGLPGYRHGEVIAVEQTALRFAHADGCTARTTRALPDLDKSDGTTVTKVTWSGCRAHNSVSLYRIDGGGHEVPGHPSADTPEYGRSNLDISAAETIVAAFAKGGSE